MEGRGLICHYCTIDCGITGRYLPIDDGNRLLSGGTFACHATYGIKKSVTAINMRINVCLSLSKQE